MELLILAGIAGVVYYLLNNKTRRSETHKETIVQYEEIPGGYIERRIERQNDKVNTEFHRDKTITSSPTPREKTQEAIEHSEEKVLPYRSANTVYQQKTGPAPQAQPLPNPKTPELKLCTGCNNRLPLTAFRQNSNQKDGLTKWCATCLDSPSTKTKSNTKYCPNCKKNRLKTSFSRSKKTEDGLTKWCKYCHRKR